MDFRSSRRVGIQQHNPQPARFRAKLYSAERACMIPGNCMTGHATMRKATAHLYVCVSLPSSSHIVTNNKTSYHVLPNGHRYAGLPEGPLLLVMSPPLSEQESPRMKGGYNRQVNKSANILIIFPRFRLRTSRTTTTPLKTLAFMRF